MEERLKIGDRVHVLVAREVAPGRVRLEVDGMAEEVERVGTLDAGHLVSMGGTLAALWVARTPEGTWVWHRGRARLVERTTGERAPVASELRPGGAPRSGGPGTKPGAARPLPAGAVTPPMPSVVVAVLVEVGQTVARGAPLLVVTAMKTETQLAAPADGLVTAIHTRVGARVRPGDVLVEIASGGESRGR